MRQKPLRRKIYRNRDTLSASITDFFPCYSKFNLTDYWFHFKVALLSYLLAFVQSTSEGYLVLDGINLITLRIHYMMQIFWINPDCRQMKIVDILQKSYHFCTRERMFGLLVSCNSYWDHLLVFFYYASYDFWKILQRMYNQFLQTQWMMRTKSRLQYRNILKLLIYRGILYSLLHRFILWPLLTFLMDRHYPGAFDNILSVENEGVSQC